jgi:deazaflavin-dependent oxidoreductase (nitroreductase family)
MLKALFKPMFNLMTFLYRATKGKFGGEVQGLPVLLLTTTGRRSGKQRTTPLGFFEEDGGYVICASNAGFEPNPAWFYNLKSNPHAKIEIKDRPLEINAEITTGDRRKQLWDRLVQLAPGYGNYATKTTREIPMIILRPVPS